MTFTRVFVFLSRGNLFTTYNYVRVSYKKYTVTSISRQYDLRIRQHRRRLPMSVDLHFVCAFAEMKRAGTTCSALLQFFAKRDNIVDFIRRNSIEQFRFRCVCIENCVSDRNEKPALNAEVKVPQLI